MLSSLLFGIVSLSSLLTVLCHAEGPRLSIKNIDKMSANQSENVIPETKILKKSACGVQKALKH